jgi:hypothetical protein
MPFATEFNTSRILTEHAGDIPEDISKWEPYKKSIYFLNKLDKTKLYNYKYFCENPLDNISKVFKPLEFTDNKHFVYVGGMPSYHKSQYCERLTNNFTNFKIPEKIIEKGDEAIDEFRAWFKENQDVFTRKPEIYQVRLLAKYNIEQGLEQVEYSNSGSVYKENLTIKRIESRIDSILSNAAKYYNEDEKRKTIISKFKKSTYYAFREATVPGIPFGYSDLEVKKILKEYFFLFVKPIIKLLELHFQFTYKSNIEIDESIFEYLKFRKCNHCYSAEYNEKSRINDERLQYLKTKFGDFEFPIEPGVIIFKDFPDNDTRIAYVYAFVYGLKTEEIFNDENGNYKIFKCQILNKYDQFQMLQTKVYDYDKIELFKNYLTKIENKISSNISSCLTTYFDYL